MKTRRSNIDKLFIGLNVAFAIVALSQGKIGAAALNATLAGALYISTDPELREKFNKDPLSLLKK